MLRCFFRALEFTQVTTSTIESIYTFILPVLNLLLELCVSASDLPTNVLKIYRANRHLLICHFLYLGSTKNRMLQLYQQSINTGFTSIAFNWKKFNVINWRKIMRPRSPDKVSKVRTLLLGYSKSPNM